LLNFESKPKFFKGVYPSLMPTSDSRKSSLDFYNSLLKSMSLGLDHRELSYSNYGCLYRLEKMTDSESNLDRQELEKVIAMVQERMLTTFEDFERLQAQECHILALKKLN